MTIKVHWQEKFRGPEFEPISFLLKSVTTDTLKDSKGRPVWTVFAKHLSDEAEEQMAKVARIEEDGLLKNIAEHGHGSIAQLAVRMGWFTTTHEPHKSKTHRALERLKNAKPALVKMERDRIVLTEAGSKAAKAAGTARPAGADGDLERNVERHDDE
jgi:hypothetical protein